MQSTDWTTPPLSLYIYYGMGGPLILYISTQECAQTHVYIYIYKCVSIRGTQRRPF